MYSSLKDHYDSIYIAGELVCERDYTWDKTCFLLVEGKDDKKVYSKFVSEASCKIITCNGRPYVKEVIKCLKRSKWRSNRYLGIIDSDFDVFRSRSIPHDPNLVPTDGHDLEVMILKTQALEYFVDMQLADKDKALVNEFKSSIRRCLLFDLGPLIGYMRKELYDYGIRNPQKLNCLTARYLKNLDSDCKLSLPKAISITRASFPKFDESQLSIKKKEFRRLKRTRRLHLCHGKDMIKILRVIFPKMTEKHFGKKIYLRDVKKQLFETFDQPHFKKTRLYKRIKEWEANNQPYRVLKE